MSLSSKKPKENLILHDSDILSDIPDFNNEIAEIAYYKSESRGFLPGFELDDWLEAEREYMQEMDKYR